jgi:hypothetical protein
MKPYFVPLVPRAGLHLFVWAWPDTRTIERSEAERFARLFHEVWAGIAPSDRKAMLRFWGKDRYWLGDTPRPAVAYVKLYDCFGEKIIGPPTPPRVPEIELCLGKKWPRGFGKHMAMTSEDGLDLTFDASRLPKRDAGMRNVIAHELGHVRLDAAGCGVFELHPGNALDYAVSPVEIAAELLAAFWGFEPTGGYTISEKILKLAIKRTPDHPTFVWLARWLLSHRASKRAR